MDLSNLDIGKVFYFDVYNSSDIQVYEPKHKFKIALDSQNCCPSDTGCTSGFPQGYALFKHFPYDNKWYNQMCLQSSSIEIYDDYITGTGFGSMCNKDNKVKIGHYMIHFLEEGQVKGSSLFCITPDFSSTDKIIFTDISKGLRVYRDGGEESGNIGIITTDESVTLSIREFCSEWEGGLASIANYTYYPIDQSSYSTGHQIHTGNPSQGSEQNGCPCVMGYFSPEYGNLNIDSSNYATFTSTWNLPNTAGTYTFRMYLSKNFDGRTFATHNDSKKRFGFSLYKLDGASGDGHMYVIKQCEAGDHHCNQTTFYDRYMDFRSIVMLGNIFNKLLQRIWDENPDLRGYMPVITAGSLEKGGCFDINGDYNCPHTKHKMGHNVDISLKLKNLSGNEVTYNFLSIINRIITREYGTNSGSFCQIHNNNHYHCRFYNGWYNNL